MKQIWFVVSTIDGFRKQAIAPVDMQIFDLCSLDFWTITRTAGLTKGTLIFQLSGWVPSFLLKSSQGLDNVKIRVITVIII